MNFDFSSKYFSVNGRLIISPIKIDKCLNGNDYIIISFFKIEDQYTFSIKAQIQKRIFAKFPHPEDQLYNSIFECRFQAKSDLKNWCNQNKLKKAFNRLIPSITDQLDLFDDL